MYRVLIAEDDPAIAELLQMNLTISGYACIVASDGLQALAAVRKQQFALALLDIMLPFMDGFELLPTMRKHGIPAIFVSARGDIADRVRGLRLGAEDYLVKPFDILELLVRMEKVLSRTHAAPPVLNAAGVTVWEAERRACVLDHDVELKPMEYALMLMFMKHPNMVLSREQLLHEVWGDEYLGETRTVDSHVAVLRKKLDWASKLITVHRVGYRLEVAR